MLGGVDEPGSEVVPNSEALGVKFEITWCELEVMIRYVAG